jgi:drug/metabolite transporter (DMT)-like permease
MLAPILSAVSLAAGTILEKIVLVKKKITLGFYQTWGFLAISLLSIPLLFFFWKISPEAHSFKNILIFIAVILVSLGANFFTFYGIKKEKISKIEPAAITEPLFTLLLAILFSYLISPTLYESNTKVIIPALIAAAALVFSHVKKHHLRFGKPFLAVLLGSFFYALELILSRLILDYYSAVTFYFLRCFFLFVFSLLIFRPNMKEHIKTKITFQIFLSAALFIAYRVLLYYGYLKLGIISTTLMIILSPVFIYIFSWILLKEKPTWKNIVASVIIIGCVIYTIFN